MAQALQQVTQAKGDLNGNHNLQVAKDNANTAIDQLPNLNQPQNSIKRPHMQNLLQVLMLLSKMLMH